MLVPGVQQSDLVMHIYVYIIFFFLFSIIVYYNILNIVPYATQYQVYFKGKKKKELALVACPLEKWRLYFILKCLDLSRLWCHLEIEFCIT